MIPIVTQKDIIEATKLQRRILYEDERKKRIFRARHRNIGLDIPYLDHQVAVKAERREFKAECKRQHDHNLKVRQLAVFGKSIEMERRQKILDNEELKYRCIAQQYELRREFDLNDPMIIKNALPARVCDVDDKLGISSLQIFAGEDLGFEDRKLEQREQMRQWLTQQMDERTKAKEDKIKSDIAAEDNMRDRQERIKDMIKMEIKTRKQIDDEICAFNKTLEYKRIDELERAKDIKYEDDMAEICNMMRSDMLSENPEAATSSINPQKKIAYMYRGMTPEELDGLRAAQYRQKVENGKRRIDLQLKKDLFDQSIIHKDRDIVLKQIEVDRQAQDRIDNHAIYNRHLSLEQKERNANSKEYYRNVVTKEYFEQFNTTSR